MFYFIIRRKLYEIRRYVLYMIFQYGYDRTGSNPQDINRFGSNSGEKKLFLSKTIKLFIYNYLLFGLLGHRFGMGWLKEQKAQ